jgi:hypothetical protein
MGKKKNQIIPPPLPPSESKTLPVGLMVACLVAIIAIGLGTQLFLRSDAGSAPPAAPRLLFREHQIQRRNFDSKASFSSYLDEKGLPVVITGPVLSHFPRWNISDVVAMVPSDHLSGFYQHSSPIFGPYYDDQRPMHNLSTVQGSTPYQANASLPVGDIDRIFHQFRPQTFYSFSSSLSDLNPSLEQQLDLSEMLQLNPSHSSVNLWLGMRGGTTPCHYDGYHNMCARDFLSSSLHLLPLLPPPPSPLVHRYLQMSGIKHFLLFPPGDPPPIPPPRLTLAPPFPYPTPSV